MLSRGSERNRGCDAGNPNAMPDRARSALSSLRSASSDDRERIARKHAYIIAPPSHFLDMALPSASPEIDLQGSLALLRFFQNQASKLTFDNKGLVKVRIYRLFARARDNGLTRLHRWSSFARAHLRACLTCRPIEPAQLLARLLALARRFQMC